MTIQSIPAGTRAMLNLALSLSIVPLMSRSALCQLDAVSIPRRPPADAPVSLQLPVRDAYEQHNRAAVAARSAGDWAAVRRHAAAVDILFNGNPSALMAVARASARLGDSSAALELLGTIASMGVMRNLAADADLASLHSASAWSAVIDRNERNSQPVGTFQPVVSVPSFDFLAEDILWDGERGRYLVSSVRKGSILTILPDGTSADFLTRGSANLWGAFGLALDSARSRLWVSTVAMPYVEDFSAADSGKAAIVRVSLRTGEVEKRYDIPPTARGSSPGDISVSPRGDLYVSDSRSGIVHVIRVASDSLEVLVADGTFMSPQGSVSSADGSVLYVADYIRGLAEIQLATRNVRWLSHPRGMALNGIDGLVLVAPDRLIAVQNGVMPNRVMSLTLDPVDGAITSAQVIVQDTSKIREPTHGVVIGDDFHFIANSGWDGFDDNGALLKDFRLLPPAIVSVRLR